VASKALPTQDALDFGLQKALLDYTPSQALKLLEKGAKASAHLYFIATETETDTMRFRSARTKDMHQVTPYLAPNDLVLSAAAYSLMNFHGDVVPANKPLLPTRFFNLIEAGKLPENRARAWLQRNRGYQSQQPDMLTVAYALLSRGEPAKRWQAGDLKPVPVYQ